jgi:hypothetical protein
MLGRGALRAPLLQLELLLESASFKACCLQRRAQMTRLGLELIALSTQLGYRLGPSLVGRSDVRVLSIPSWV